LMGLLYLTTIYPVYIHSPMFFFYHFSFPLRPGGFA
jgi:hypothetical protein